MKIGLNYLHPKYIVNLYSFVYILYFDNIKVNKWNTCFLQDLKVKVV